MIVVCAIVVSLLLFSLKLRLSIPMFAIAVSLRLFCDFHVLRLSIVSLCCNDMPLLSCLLRVSVLFSHILNNAGLLQAMSLEEGYEEGSSTCSTSHEEEGDAGVEEEARESCSHTLRSRASSRPSKAMKELKKKPAQVARKH